MASTGGETRREHGDPNAEPGRSGVFAAVVVGIGVEEGGDRIRRLRWDRPGSRPPRACDESGPHSVLGPRRPCRVPHSFGCWTTTDGPMNDISQIRATGGPVTTVDESLNERGDGAVKALERTTTGWSNWRIGAARTTRHGGRSRKVPTPPTTTTPAASRTGPTSNGNRGPHRSRTHPAGNYESVSATTNSVNTVPRAGSDAPTAPPSGPRMDDQRNW